MRRLKCRVVDHAKEDARPAVRPRRCTPRPVVPRVHRHNGPAAEGQREAESERETETSIRAVMEGSAVFGRPTTANRDGENVLPTFVEQTWIEEHGVKERAFLERRSATEGRIREQRNTVQPCVAVPCARQ